jgi:hypothetical protein
VRIGRPRATSGLSQPEAGRDHPPHAHRRRRHPSISLGRAGRPRSGMALNGTTLLLLSRWRNPGEEHVFGAVSRLRPGLDEGGGEAVLQAGEALVDAYWPAGAPGGA